MHAVAFAQHAAFVDPLDHRADRLAAEGAAAPGAVAGMVGELHGVHRPHLDADALQREHGGGVADMAVGDMGLDRQDVHARPAACPQGGRVRTSRRGGTCRLGRVLHETQQSHEALGLARARPDHS